MRRATVLLGLLIVAIVGAIAAKSVLLQPPPLRTNNAAGQFDATRAKGRLGFILGDQQPHPADTRADDQVRARIVALLQRMGVQPVVRDQFACNELYKIRGVSCARVRNVIAILGPRTGKALLLNAHYDSVPVGPGAADDGVGVATLLEVASILKDRPLKRPVIFLFNEGEESGLIGARAFLADPLSRNVDSVLNLEARGVRGPATMFETSVPNGPAIEVFSRAIANPMANSLSTDVYHLLPNLTDVTTFSERGWLALNTALIGNETRYHSAGDDLAALSPASLQHMGDQTLALAEQLANGAPAGGDRCVFMDIAGQMLVALPLTFGVALLVALFAGFAWLAWRRGNTALGSAFVIVVLIASGVLCWACVSLLGLARPGMFWRAHPIWIHLAGYASTLFVAVALLAVIRRLITRDRLWVSLWLIFLVIGALLALIAPGGIIYFLFPPLFALIGIIAARWWTPAERIGSALAIIAVAITWGELLALLELLLNQGPMWLFAPLSTFIILPVLIEAKPLIDRASARAATGFAALLALLGWAVAAAAPAYSADRQQRFVIEHVTDARSGHSWWSVLNDGAALPDGFAAAGKWRLGSLPYSERQRWLATAPSAAVTPPALQIVSQRQSGADRTIVIRLHSNGSQRIELVAPEDSKIRRVGASGSMQPIDPMAGDGKYYIACAGRSCDGATLEVDVARAEPISFTMVGSRSGLPTSAAPLVAARPMFARPQYAPDETVVFSRVKL